MRIDSRFADELTVVRGEGHDVIEHVELYRLTAIFPTNVEVTHLAEVAQRDVTAHVDDVGANAPVWIVDERVRLRFGARVVGNSWRASTHAAVWSHVVVVTNDVF